MNDKILRLPRVIDKTGMPRTAIYNGMIEGTFPKSIRLTERTVGWLESEINQWIEIRVRQRRQFEEGSLCQK
jgi:prophage regulatory protein